MRPSPICCAGCGEPHEEIRVWRTRTWCPPCLDHFTAQYAGFERYVRMLLHKW